MDRDLRSSMDEALAALGAELGQSTLRLDDNGTIGLDFADDVSCTIEAPAGSRYVHLHGPVGHVPSYGRQAFLERLLSSNVFGLGLPGAWLALDGDEVLLCASVPGAMLDAQSLPDFLLAFTDEIRDIRRGLIAPNAAPAALDFAVEHIRG